MGSLWESTAERGLVGTLWASSDGPGDRPAWAASAVPPAAVAIGIANRDHDAHAPHGPVGWPVPRGTVADSGNSPGLSLFLTSGLRLKILLTQGVAGPVRERSRVEWDILLTPEVEAFLDELYESDPASHQLVNQAILVLERNGPAEGRPLVDTITASRIANLKELRPPSAGRSEIRILLAFDPWRSAVLLVAGDKSGQWNKWYRTAIPRAEQLYEDYLAERRKETEP